MNQRGFVIPSFLLSPTGIMAAMIVALSLSNALFYQLYTGAKDDLITYTAQVSLANAQIEADVQRRLRLSEQVTAEVRNDLDAALAKLRKRPAVRVLQPKCDTGTGQAISAPTGVTLETPAADAIDPPVLTAAECEERLGDGIEDAVRLAWLQEWIRQQQKAMQ